MKTEYFKHENQNNRIDSLGNHYVNGKCVNLKSYEGNVGDTHPDAKLREPAITKTGFVPHKIVNEKFVVL